MPLFQHNYFTQAKLKLNLHAHTNFEHEVLPHTPSCIFTYHKGGTLFTTEPQRTKGESFQKQIVHPQHKIRTELRQHCKTKREQTRRNGSLGAIKHFTTEEMEKIISLSFVVVV